jgi:hypothetical protein
MMRLMKLNEGPAMDIEKRRQWSFRMTKANTWSWRTVDVDNSELVSAREFETLAECIVDAKEHGYVVFTLSEERRKRETRSALE